jgi:DNA-binding NtrC family response regulator
VASGLLYHHAAGQPKFAFALTCAMANKYNEINKKTILLMNADPEQSAGIAHLLKEADFNTQSVTSSSELKKKLDNASFIAVIMDLDSLTLDNRSIKDLTMQFPTVPFLCVSKERFHPELKDSIRDHIYACLTKPIDPDELKYWLKCIREDDRKPEVG